MDNFSGLFLNGLNDGRLIIVSFPLKVGPCDVLITKHFGVWIDGSETVFG